MPRPGGCGTRQRPALHRAGRMADDRAMKVIVVEDEVVTQMLIADALGEAGYDVLVAGSGEAAMGLADTVEPVALVIDIHLAHGMSGYDYAKAVRRRWGNVGVVYISGNRANIAGRSIAVHERFLPKPFGRADLVAAVGSVASAVPQARPSNPM